jgi:hypothetical protein
MPPRSQKSQADSVVTQTPADTNTATPTRLPKRPLESYWIKVTIPSSERKPAGAGFECRAPVKKEAIDAETQVKVEISGYCGLSYRTNSFQREKFSQHFKSAHPEVELMDGKTDNSETTARQPTIDGFLRPASNEAEDLAPLHTMLSVWSRFGLSFRLSADAEMRSILKLTPPTRERFPAMLDEEADRLLKITSQFFTSPTLCIDVGTVHRRYLVFTIVQPLPSATGSGKSRGRVQVTNAICDSELHDKRMTTDNIRSCVMNEILRLQGFGVYPLFVVADNASNMQGIANSESDEDEQDLGESDGEEDGGEAEVVGSPEALGQLKEELGQILFVLRCAAHVVQLVTKDTEPHWSAGFEVARAYRDNHTKAGLPVPMDAKWNAKFHLISAVRKLATSTASTEFSREQLAHLHNAHAMLRPLNGATNFLQRDGATLFDVLCMWSRLLEEYSVAGVEAGDEAPPERRRAYAGMLHAVKKRFTYMMSPLHVAAVYFLPFTNRSECSAEVEAIVGNVLTKINPTVEWGAYLKVAPPAATDSTRCTWPDLIEFLGTEEVASHSNLRQTLVMLYSSSPTEASVERAFSHMKHTVAPIRNKMLPGSVRSSMIVASAKRLIAQVKKEEATAPEPADPFMAQAAAEAKRARAENTIVRTRNQADASDWAEFVSLDAALFVLASGPGRVDAKLHDRDLKDVLRQRRVAVSHCAVCMKPLHNHEVKPYITCRTRKGCRAQPANVNYECARHPRHRVAVKDQQDLRQVDFLVWDCPKCPN